MLSAHFWIIPAAILGAIVGSFLNVVIFRLPRGLSISNPRWSFCPHCRNRIRPYHNLPVIGWLALRGRCHHCRAPISIVYPVVECSTALLFVMIWDALFITKTLPGIGQLQADWPMAIAFLALFAGFLASSVMDIESYTIDIRISIFIMVVGCLCYGIWGVSGIETSSIPMPDANGVQLIRPIQNPPSAIGAYNTHEQTIGLLPPSLSLIGIAMGLTWCITRLWVTRFGNRNLHDEDISQPVENQFQMENPAAASTTSQNFTKQRFQPIPIIALATVVSAMIFWMRDAPGWDFGWPSGPGPLRGLIACSVFMFLLILASLVRREADQQIVEEIEAESMHARSVALHELAWFLPALLVGLGLLIYFRLSGRMGDDLASLLFASSPGAVWMGHLHGVIQSIAAMVFAASLGWTVRIAGTLAFGKEAFGTGDIYIMASLAAVGGIWMVLFTFFLAALLALVGAGVILLRKSSRAIPFGPWLALGAFVNLWLFGPLLEYFRAAGMLFWSVLSGEPISFLIS